MQTNAKQRAVRRWAEDGEEMDWTYMEGRIHNLFFFYIIKEDPSEDY